MLQKLHITYDIMLSLLQGTQGMKQYPEERNSLVYDVMFSLLQGTQAMKQCPEERNSLIYEVLFSEFRSTTSPVRRQDPEKPEAKYK